MTIKDQTAIVGVGQTAYAKGLEGSELSLACQAIKAALDDAGLTPAERLTMQPEQGMIKGCR